MGGTPLQRVAMLSVHTSPLDDPGGGDAGGMNVYIVETAKRLAARGVDVEIFTRSTASNQPPDERLCPGVLVRHVTAGPFEGLAKDDLPAQLCAFTAGVLRAEARQDPGYYDLVHSHYWLSGHVGWLARERWGVPLVHSAHTLAKVKNALLADDDTPEPRARVIGEEQVVAEADRLIASTRDEAEQLIHLYGADPDKVRTIAPGVDLEGFVPGDSAAARARLGLRPDALTLLFVGRIQPLKAPDVLLRAAAMLQQDPQLAGRLQVVVLGAPSGTGLARPRHLETLRDELGLGDAVTFRPPASRAVVADYYRAADLTVVPSYNESFGLVALESQACGTPVVGSRRRRPAHGHRRRCFGPARRRARSRPVGQGPGGRPPHPGPARTAGARRATARRTVLLGPHGRGSARGLPRGHRRGGEHEGVGDPAVTVADTIETALQELDVEWQRLDETTFAVALPGEKRLKTACVLTVGAHAVAIEAFVLRKPEENREQVYAWLLQRNARMYAVSWSIDSHGDVYLVGRVPLGAIDAEELDRIFGSVLENSDGSFNVLLEMGFGSSIKREWAWRVKNDQPLANLAAFANFAQRP